MAQQSKNNKEIEYKWQIQSIHDFKAFLLHAKNLGATLTKLKKIHINDLYLETPLHFFHNIQRQCRIRFSKNHSELTLKSFSNTKKGIFVRTENTLKLPRLNSLNAALTHCQKHYFPSIQPLFEVNNNRQLCILTLPDGTRAEACFDQVAIVKDNNKFHFCELELGFKSGRLKNFNTFVKQLSPLALNPSKASKYQVGMQHFFKNISTPTAERLYNTANEVLESNLDKVLKNEELFRENYSSDAIHDMRVATRRLRAALKAFNDFLHAKDNKIRKQLKTLGEYLGKKRDLDVFFEFVLKTIPANSKTIPILNKLRTKSQKRFLNRISSKWYPKLLQTLKYLKATQTAQNVFSFALQLIRQSLKIVLKFAPILDSTTDDKTLHALRIAMKKLRYVCEFFEPHFNTCVCSFSTWIDKAKEIQDCLGEHQDAIIGYAKLLDMKKIFSQKEFLQIKENYDLKKKKARQIFFRIWKDFWFGVGFRRNKPTTALELILNR